MATDLCRVFNDVHGCDLWKWYVDRLCERFGDAAGKSAAVAALQLYSDKTLINMKGEHAYRSQVLIM